MATGKIIEGREYSGDLTFAFGGDGAGTATVVVNGGESVTLQAGAVINGEHGVLTISDDGKAWSYSASHDLGEDTFTFAIQDADGDKAPNQTLSFNVEKLLAGATLGEVDEAAIEIHESSLSTGTAPNAADLTKTVKIAVDAPDGFTSLEVNGVAVGSTAKTISTANGSAQVTATYADGELSLTYKLNKTFGHELDADNFLDSLNVKLVDLNGDISERSVNFDIVDDMPTMIGKEWLVTQSGSWELLGYNSDSIVYNIPTDVTSKFTFGTMSYITMGADQAGALV